MRVTVAIPTLNAGTAFEAVLEAVRAQEPAPSILVIDSGSLDGTAHLASRMGARVHEIPNHEFGHGRTRNLAIDLTDTEIVAFLTQDAEPLPGWLPQLLRPFDISESIAAVFGCQVARPGVRAPVRRELEDVARQLGPSDGVVMHGRNLVGAEPSWASQFFTNVNSAVRRSFLLEIPFRDVDYAEDQALAADLHAAGLLTGYAPLAKVLHSHDYPLVQHFRRAYDDTVGLRKSTGRAAKTGLARHVATAAVLSARDGASVFRSDDHWRARVGRAAASPAFELARRLAIALGRRDQPAVIHRLLSLEAGRRRGG